MPEALQYNASLSETRRNSQAIIRHAELVSASNHSQAEERLCHRSINARSKKVIADSICNASAMTDFSRDVKRSKAAFTLAEVLITLGIIGVVAALTLPTLVQNYQEKATVSKLKKAYSIMNNAYKLAKNEYGEFSEWFTEPSSANYDKEGKLESWSDAAIKNGELLWNKFIPFLNVSSFCKPKDTNCKKYDTVYLLDGTVRETIQVNNPIVNLNDGMAIYAGWIHNITCDPKNKYGVCADFAIDVNGINNGPNTVGRDIFYFYITAESIRPIGDAFSVQNFDTYCNLSAKTRNNGYACSAWVIQNENMDYLHCNDLSWDGKTKCK